MATPQMSLSQGFYRKESALGVNIRAALVSIIELQQTISRLLEADSAAIRLKRNVTLVGLVGVFFICVLTSYVV